MHIPAPGSQRKRPRKGPESGVSPGQVGANGRGSRRLSNTPAARKVPDCKEASFALPALPWPSSGRRLLPATSADDSPVRPAADDGPSIIRSADDRTAVIGRAISVIRPADHHTAVIGGAISVIWSPDDRTAIIGGAIADDCPVGSAAHDRSTVGSSPDHICRIVDAVGRAGEVGRRGIVCRCACGQTGGSSRKHDGKAESKSGDEHAGRLTASASSLIVSTGFRICCRPRPRRRSSCRFSDHSDGDCEAIFRHACNPTSCWRASSRSGGIAATSQSAALLG
jgi:hypothetical protein